MAVEANNRESLSGIWGEISDNGDALKESLKLDATPWVRGDVMTNDSAMDYSGR